MRSGISGAAECGAEGLQWNYMVTHQVEAYISLTTIWEFPRLVGRYCSYILPKQARVTPQVDVNKI